MNSINTQSGVTLVELLITVLIFALITVMGFTSLYHIREANDITKEKMKGLNDLRIVITRLEKDLTYVQDRPVRDQNGDSVAALKAGTLNEQVLEFSYYQGDSVVQPNRSNLRRVRYTFRNNTLYRAVWPVMDRSHDSKAQEYKMLGKIESFKISFYDAKNQTHPEWPPQTGPGGSLPKAVLFEIDLGKQGKVSRLITTQESYQ